MRYPPLFLFLSSLLLLPAPARASVLLQLKLENLVAHAESIVEAEVISSRGFWSADRRSINTETTLRVERGLLERERPAAGQTIVVNTLGGKVGNVRMHVAGAPRLREGERVILFLEKRQGRRWVVGMNQGVFDLVKRDGEAHVRQRLRGAALVQKTAGGLKSVPSRPITEEIWRFKERVVKARAACAREQGRCLVR